MNVFQKFAVSFGFGPSPPRRPVPRAELLAAVGRIERALIELRPPALTLAQRRRAARALRPGLLQVMRALHGTLAHLPDLGAAVGLGAPAMEALRLKDGELLGLIQRAVGLAERCVAGQHAAMLDLKQRVDRVLGAARRLRGAPGSPEHEAMSLVLDSVEAFTGKRARSLGQRRALEAKRLAALRALHAAPGGSAEATGPKSTAGAAGPAASGARGPAGPRRDRGTGTEATIDRDPFADVPLEVFCRCSKALAEITEQLGPQPPPSGDFVDYLFDGDLAGLVADLLRSSAALRQAAGESPAALERLAGEISGYTLLLDGAELLATRAAAGHLAAAGFTLDLAARALGWGDGRLADPALAGEARLQLFAEVKLLRDQLARMRGRALAHAASTQARKQKLYDQIDEAEARRNLEDVKARLARGEKVDPASLYAAEAQQRKVAERDMMAFVAAAKKNAIEAERFRKGLPPLRPRKPRKPRKR